MISVTKPYGAVATDLMKSKYELNGKFYVADKQNNRYEVDEKEYPNIKLPIKERGYQK